MTLIKDIYFAPIVINAKITESLAPKTGHWNDYTNDLNWGITTLIPNTYVKPPKPPEKPPEKRPPHKRPPDDDPPPDDPTPPPVQHDWTTVSPDPQNRQQENPWVTFPSSHGEMWFGDVQSPGVYLNSGKDKDLKAKALGVTYADLHSSLPGDVGIQNQFRLGYRSSPGGSGYTTITRTNWKGAGTTVNEGGSVRFEMTDWFLLRTPVNGSYRIEVYGCSVYGNDTVRVGRGSGDWTTGAMMKYEWQFCRANHSHFNYKEEDCDWIPMSKIVRIKIKVIKNKNNG